MSRRSPAGVLLLSALFCFTGSALAQPPEQASPSLGYWAGDKWIGYQPAKPKHRERTPSRRGVRAERPPVQQRPVQQQVVPTNFQEEMSLGVNEVLVDRGETISGHAGDCCPQTSCQESCYSTRQVWGQEVWGRRVWARAEYQLWWTKGMNAPPLVTTGPDNAPQNEAGRLGQPGTRILFGNTELTSDSRSGGRFTLGKWLDSCETWGLEATYMTLGDETESFGASSDNRTILARPFRNAVSGAQSALLIAYPNFVEGNVAVTATTEFQGMEVLFRRAGRRNCCSKIDFLIGWRWAQLNDALLIDEFTISRATGSDGATIALFDRFDTKNDFHGVEFGVNFQRQLGPCWSLDLLGKIALGGTNSVTRIRGQATATDIASQVTVTEGGLLAQPTNIGNYSQNNFAVVSEFGVTLRRRFRCGLEATFGYSVIYLSDVARAGDQIDFDVNVSQIPNNPLVGPAQPAFAFHTTDFWAQGLNFGLNYQF